jgi:hypothetical protein
VAADAVMMMAVGLLLMIAELLETTDKMSAMNDVFEVNVMPGECRVASGLNTRLEHVH